MDFPIHIFHYWWIYPYAFWQFDIIGMVNNWERDGWIIWNLDRV